MKRTLMVSPIDLAFLIGTSNGINRVNKKRIDFPHIVYSSLIMCGVDLIGTMENGLPEKVRHYQNSIVAKHEYPDIKTREWVNSFYHIEQILKQYDSSANPFRLASFLANLIFSLENHTAFTVSYNFNELSEKLCFHHEIDILLKLFISKAIEASRVTLPIVRMDIGKSDTYRLLDLVQSKEFSNYKEAHQEIEEGIVFNNACKSIMTAGNDLYNSNKKLLIKKENAFIGGIGLISEIIESLFGKLSKKLFDVFLSEPLKKISHDYKRIPLYSYDMIADDIMNKEVREWIKQNPYVFDKMNE